MIEILEGHGVPAQFGLSQRVFSAVLNDWHHQYRNILNELTNNYLPCSYVSTFIEVVAKQLN